MEKTIFEQLGGTYTQQGDYLLPDVKLPEEEHGDIGVWGNRRRQFLKQHHRIKYYNMLAKCTLYPHLADVEQQANALFLRLVDELAEKEGVTEQLKAEDTVAWVKKMNSIRSQVSDIVLNNLIYK